jgi:hypothetical protein
MERKAGPGCGNNGESEEEVIVPVQDGGLIVALRTNVRIDGTGQKCRT